MDIEELSFPVLSISGTSMVSAQTPKNLALGTRKAVSDGYFEKVEVIDSDGSRVSLGSAKPQTGANPFGVVAWYVGLPTKLEFDSVMKLPPLSLAEFKNTVSEQLNRDRGFWGSVGVGFDGIQQRVKAASTFREIISLFF